jgi:hypothetical protein
MHNQFGDPRRQRQFVRQYQIRNGYHGSKKPINRDSLNLSIGATFLAIAVIGAIYLILFAK